MYRLIGELPLRKNRFYHPIRSTTSNLVLKNVKSNLQQTKEPHRLLFAHRKEWDRKVCPDTRTNEINRNVFQDRDICVPATFDSNRISHTTPLNDIGHVRFQMCVSKLDLGSPNTRGTPRVSPWRKSILESRSRSRVFRLTLLVGSYRRLWFVTDVWLNGVVVVCQ